MHINMFSFIINNVFTSETKFYIRINKTFIISDKKIQFYFKFLTEHMLYYCAHK